MNNVKAIQKLNETELKLGVGSKKSWHHMYSGSAYVFIGGLDYGLTEGDVLAIFSQYGEIVNINLVKDKKTGKSKGFCFLAYEDQRSTILAVDNLNAIKMCGRTIRVDHVSEYRRPKDEQGNEIIEKGCAPKTPTPSPTHSPSPPPLSPTAHKKKKKKKLKEKKLKKIKADDSGSDTHSKKEIRRCKPREKYVAGKGRLSKRRYSSESDEMSNGSNSPHNEANPALRNRSISRSRERKIRHSRSRSRSRGRRAPEVRARRSRSRERIDREVRPRGLWSKDHDTSHQHHSRTRSRSKERRRY